MGQSALKGALQQYSNDVFFVFLRAVQIADRLRRRPCDFARLLQVLARFVHAFAFKQLFRFRHSLRRRTGATYRDLDITDRFSSAINRERHGNSHTGPLQIAKF